MADKVTPKIADCKAGKINLAVLVDWAKGFDWQTPGKYSKGPEDFKNGAEWQA